MDDATIASTIDARPGASPDPTREPPPGVPPEVPPDAPAEFPADLLLELASPLPPGEALLPFALLLALLALPLGGAGWWVLRSAAQRAPDAGPPRRIEPLAGLMLMAALLLMGGLCAGLFSRAAEAGTLPARAFAMLGLVLGQVLLLPLVAHALRRDATSSDTGRQPISTGRAALLGAAAMLLCYPAVATIGNGLAWLQAALSDAPSEALAHDTLQALAAEGWTLWSLLVAVIATTGIPLCEEVLYRGLLQSAIAAALPRAGRWVAIWIASLLFVLMHLPALDASAMAGALGALLALSLLLGLLYERTGRLAAPIAAHALFNLINLLLAASIA